MQSWLYSLNISKSAGIAVIWEKQSDQKGSFNVSNGWGWNGHKLYTCINVFLKNTFTTSNAQAYFSTK